MDKARWIKQTLFFCLVWVSSAWTEQMDVCFLSGPDALKIEQIYKDDVDNGELWIKRGPLTDCSSSRESESVPLDSCRVCVRNEQEVKASCRRISSSAELHFEGDGEALQKSCRSHDITTTTPAPTTLTTAPPLQSDAPPPPGLGAGDIAGICVGVVFGLLAVLAVGVAYTKGEMIRSWWNSRRCHTRVPTRDQKVEYRAPAANGHAPSLLEALSPDTGAESRKEFGATLVIQEKLAS